MRTDDKPQAGEGEERAFWAWGMGEPASPPHTAALGLVIKTIITDLTVWLQL